MTWRAWLRARTRSFGRLDVMVCNAGFGYYGTLEDTPPDTMQRMMDVNFMGTFYGARAALPAFRAQSSGHIIIMSSIVGQRGIAQMSAYSATKAAQVGFAEGLRAEFAGTGIHVSVVYPVSTTTEFRQAMERDFGHSVSGLGPKQSVDEVARAVVACIRRPRPEVYPHALSRGLAILNAVAPGLSDRLVRKVRPSTHLRPMGSETFADPGFAIVIALAQRVKDAGGRALIVGGWVRDRLMGRVSKDIDLEVFGLSAPALQVLLAEFGTVNTVGESFTVYKVAGIDVALPRRESKKGRGHRGFEVTGDPDLSIAEAARRRDFTINAIAWDPLTDEYLDPWNGRGDLAARVLRAVDPVTFGDDSLRVLRALQFAARFDFDLEPGTRDLCRQLDAR